MWFTWMLLALMVVFIYLELGAQELRAIERWIEQLNAEPIEPFSFERAAANARDYAASMQKLQQASITASSHLTELRDRIAAQTRPGGDA